MSTSSLVQDATIDVGLIKVHDRGDVILRTYNGKQFLVHSVYLQTVSSVWDTTLADSTAKIHASTNETPREVIVDDDPEILMLLLNLLHLRRETLPKDVSAQQLRDLAIMGDKYRCTNALQLLVQHWIMTFLQHRFRFGDMGHLVSAAAALQHAEAFEKFTYKLAFEYTESTTSLWSQGPPSESSAIMRYVFYMVEALRNNVRTRICALFRDFVEHAAKNAPITGSNCHPATEIAASCITIVKLLTGLSTGCPDQTAIETLQAELDDEEWQRSSKLDCQVCNRSHERPSSLLLARTSHDLKQIEAMMHGLCLSCAREGNASLMRCELHSRALLPSAPVIPYAQEERSAEPTRRSSSSGLFYSSA